MRTSIHNVHERVTAGPLATAAEIFGSLATKHDRLWPSERWPKLILDHGLEVGSSGGHGPIRYRVDELGPGLRVSFAMLSDSAVQGRHELAVTDTGDGRLRWAHSLEITPVSAKARAFIPLHNALIEDLLDRAEALMVGAEPVPRPFPFHVRVLRHLVNRLASRSSAPPTSVGR